MEGGTGGEGGREGLGQEGGRDWGGMPTHWDVRRNFKVEVTHTKKLMKPSLHQFLHIIINFSLILCCLGEFTFNLESVGRLEN